MATKRLSFEESCQFLKELGYFEKDCNFAFPDHLPQYDDEEPLGVSFFRTFVGEGSKLENLSLPRTFFGRSEINDVSFAQTDLSESNLCWNDFINVDFSESVLADSDIRASKFQRVRFVQADLRGADMRQSTFEECDFGGAMMNRTVLTRAQAPMLFLSKTQRDAIDWRDGNGPEPGGG